MMASQQKFYEDPSGGVRDVLYAHDEHASRKMSARADDKIEAILDWAVGTGRIRDRDE